MTQTTDKKDSTSNQRFSHYTTPFVEVTKYFNAPIETVWDSWVDPEIVKQWWGPNDYSCPSAKIDFRIDGKFLIAMKAPDEKITWGTGTYLEIFPHELIVCTDQFSDEKGNPITPIEAGMPEEWKDAELTAIYSVKFTKINDNKTEIQLVHEGIPASMHDDCVTGWSETLEKLKVLVEKH